MINKEIVKKFVKNKIESVIIFSLNMIIHFKFKWNKIIDKLKFKL